jgi:wyosine [tRNA(Phe)-imidazoG37] synthetase (radical SAM superfamily)
MTNKRESFFQVEPILNQFKAWLKTNQKADVVTIVGEGEPTLYQDLGSLIQGLKSLTEIPVAVITNGALLYDEHVRKELMHADIVLPSFDAPDEATFKKINRPYGRIDYQSVYEGLVTFSKEFEGQLWIEIMIVKNYNDTTAQLTDLKNKLEKVKFDRIFINTPVRPPAESYVEEPSEELLCKASELLGGICINKLSSNGFSSAIEDDYEAILSIIKRHPMNQYEIKNFLLSRNCDHAEEILKNMDEDHNVSSVEYKGYKTYRA